MTYTELKSAREKYGYVPARLVRIEGEVSSNGLTWKSLNLAMDVPVNWQNADEAVRARYSSFELDEFHRALLNSESEEELMHGLLSAVFWGFASVSAGRISSNRALARSRVMTAVAGDSAPGRLGILPPAKCGSGDPIEYRVMCSVMVRCGISVPI